MTRREFVGTGATLAALLANRQRLLASAQADLIRGVFVGTPNGPVELLAYADRTTIGLLRMSYGSFEDIPAFHSVSRVLCNLPNWRPEQVWLSTRMIFRDEFAERRILPFAVRPLNISALELRIRDMEDPGRVKKLLGYVRATASNPPYLFVTLSTGGVTRDYIAELLIADSPIPR
jgi:hypothetical protein